MEIQVEQTGPCKSKVTIVIPPERIKEEIEKNFSQTASAVTLPGFRKGKAPKKLISKRFGDLILEDAREKLVREAISKALEEHKLDPVSDPELDLQSIELEEDQPLEFSFELETRPDFELQEYKGLEVTLEPLQVNDDDIDEGIKALRSRFAFLKSIDDQPVDKKHYVTADLVYKVAGHEDLVREGSQANLSLGIIDGIEAGKEMENLIGKQLDEEAELEIPSLPPHFMPEDLRGKPAKLMATIKEIREVAFPEVDDEFLKKVDMKSVEELREKVHQECMEKKKASRTDEIETKLIDILVKRHPFDIPEKLLMKQISDQDRNLRFELMRLGVSNDKIDEEAAKLDEQNREAAIRNIKANFILDKISEKENIYITENEIEAELKVIAQQQNMSLQDVKKHYEERNLISSLQALLRNQKIRKMLREEAKISEESAGEPSPSEEEGAGNSETESTI